MVNIWQSYKQERGCFMHFACLANTLLKDEESALDNTIQYNAIQYNTIQYKICKAPCCRGFRGAETACNFAKYSPI